VIVKLKKQRFAHSLQNTAIR